MHSGEVGEPMKINAVGLSTPIMPSTEFIRAGHNTTEAEFVPRQSRPAPASEPAPESEPPWQATSRPARMKIWYVIVGERERFQSRRER